ncbi:MAG: hypothetical protein ABI634_11130 [Acidobacteriota bacterium]
MPLVNRHDPLLRLPLGAIVVSAMVLTFAASARAQAPSSEQPQPASPAAPPASPSTPAPSEGASSSSHDSTDPTKSADRIFGVLPNYTTVEGSARVKPITSGQSFKMAALDSFDPFVYPLFGFVAVVGQAQNQPPEWGRGWHGYSRRYGAAFADNTVCSLVTTGLMPSLLKQDPRYYQGNRTGFFHRLAYAASRSAVTKSRTGERQFNLSELGGTLVVANVSNLYYPADERNTHDTLVRWGTQTMWDTVANELKEFWPDIRQMLHGVH